MNSSDPPPWFPAGGGVMSATPSGRVTPPAEPQVGSACPVGCLCVELGSALAERSDMLEEAWLLGNRPHPGNMCVGSMCNKRLVCKYWSSVTHTHSLIPALDDWLCV